MNQKKLLVMFEGEEPPERLGQGRQLRHPAEGHRAVPWLQWVMEG